MYNTKQQNQPNNPWRAKLLALIYIHHQGVCIYDIHIYDKEYFETRKFLPSINQMHIAVQTPNIINVINILVKTLWIDQQANWKWPIELYDKSDLLLVLLTSDELPVGVVILIVELLIWGVVLVVELKVESLTVVEVDGWEEVVLVVVRPTSVTYRAVESYKMSMGYIATARIILKISFGHNGISKYPSQP